MNKIKESLGAAATFCRRHPAQTACAAVLLVLALFLLIRFVFAGGKKEEPVEQTDLTVSERDIVLLENGEERETLLSELSTVPVDPGRVYPEKLTAGNGSEDPEYVKVRIRCFWKDENGERTDLDPSLIRFTYDGEDCNTKAWKENPAEAKDGWRVFYLLRVLQEKKESAPLFDGICIGKEILDAVSFAEEDGGMRAVYAYDGARFAVEAEVQTVRAGHEGETMTDAFGVPNVSIEGDTVKIS